MSELLVIKKSPVVIIRDLIVLQIFITGFYFLAAILANYGEIYKNLSTFSELISYEIAKTIFIGIGESFLIAFIFLRWFFTTYTIYPDMVVLEKGILFKKKKTADISSAASINYHFSPLGRVFGYGAIIIRDARLAKPFIINHIPDPETQTKLITDQLKNKAHRKKWELVDGDIKKILEERERENLEFKSSFRWDAKENKLNKHLEKSVIKTIAAFLNSEGGHLVIGVSDKGEIMGLNRDYQSLNKKDADGFENHFTLALNAAIGPEFRRLVKLSFPKIDSKEVCLIKTLPSEKPVYAKLDNEDVFFVRTGNSTTSLQLREVASYIKSRWKES